MHVSLAADGVIPVPQLSVGCMGVMSAFHDFVGRNISPNSQCCKGLGVKIIPWALPVFTEAGRRDIHLR